MANTQSSTVLINGDLWQLVPVEPTKEMKVAAVKFANGPAVYKAVATAALEIEEEICADAYKAMLAEAPSGPALEPHDHIEGARAMVLPELGSVVVNQAAWKFVEAMPHRIPGPIWNDLKPALYAALQYFHGHMAAPSGPAREPLPGIKPGDFFGGRPEHAMEIDPDDFYGITEAIHHAIEMLNRHKDANTDWSPLDPKCSRRLRQALMAAWILEYPKEAAAHGITAAQKVGQHG